MHVRETLQLQIKVRGSHPDWKYIRAELCSDTKTEEVHALWHVIIIKLRVSRKIFLELGILGAQKLMNGGRRPD